MPRRPDALSPDAVSAHYARLAAGYAARANPACQRAYERLVHTQLGGAGRVLEIGCGNGAILARLGATLRIGTDLSWGMLRTGGDNAGGGRVQSDAQALPFAEAAFDGAFSINVLEHVPEPGAMLREVARVLRPGGRFVGVTPNGDLAWLLEAIEKLGLKLPEGPHRFLKTRALAQLVPPSLSLVAQRRFLAFPAGPPGLVRAMDAALPSRNGYGLFQYIVLQRRGA